MKVNDSEISRICGKHCPHYRLLLDLLSMAEQSMCMARYGSSRSISEMDECQVILDIVPSADPERVIMLGVRVNGSVVIQREQRFSDLNLKFMRATNEKWLSEVDKLFRESISSVFTAGVFKLSRQKIQDGVFEETDIDTL